MCNLPCNLIYGLKNTFLLLFPLAKAQGREASAPAARYLGYFSRKGRKGAKNAKEEKRILVCYLRLLITRYAHKTFFFPPSSSLPFASLASFAPLREELQDKPRRRRRRFASLRLCVRNFFNNTMFGIKSIRYSLAAFNGN